MYNVVTYLQNSRKLSVIIDKNSERTTVVGDLISKDEIVNYLENLSDHGLHSIEFIKCDLTNIDLTNINVSRIMLKLCSIMYMKFPKELKELSIHQCDYRQNRTLLPEKIKRLEIRSCSFDTITTNENIKNVLIEKSSGNIVDLSNSVDMDYLRISYVYKTKIYCPDKVTSLFFHAVDLQYVVLPQNMVSVKATNCHNPPIGIQWLRFDETAHLIAYHYYPLIKYGDKYIAGCRGPWSYDEAMAHWDQPERTDDRAKLYVEALRLYGAR